MDAAAWQVWRLDDNGNRFLVGVYATREQAEDKMAELMQYRHKQTYWVSEEADGFAGREK